MLSKVLGGIARFLPQNFNDTLAVVLVVSIMALWIVDAMTTMTLPQEVNGGLLVTWTLIVQYYFRKRSSE